jgi:hypothetical protein
MKLPASGVIQCLVDRIFPSIRSPLPDMFHYFQSRVLKAEMGDELLFMATTGDK